MNQAITCDEWLAGIINDTGDLSEEDFQATWVTRMGTCIADAEAAEAAAAPKMAVSGKTTWTQVECAESPKERSSHGLTYNPDDGSVYCWGGEHVARTAIDSVGTFPDDFILIVSCCLRACAVQLGASKMARGPLWRPLVLSQSLGLPMDRRLSEEHSTCGVAAR